MHNVYLNIGSKWVKLLRVAESMRWQAKNWAVSEANADWRSVRVDVLVKTQANFRHTCNSSVKTMLSETHNRCETLKNF